MTNRILLFLVISTLLILSCNDKSSENAPQTEAERIADSLQAVADSLAIKRMQHSMFQGQHIHAPGSDLAATAHQDPQQIERMRTTQREQAPARRAAAEARGRRFQEVRDSLQNDDGSMEPIEE